MKISEVNYNTKSFNNKNYTNNTTFGSYRSIFSKQLDKVLVKDRFDKDEAETLTSLINTFLKKHLSAGRILGSGFHGNVYKIDDKYVIKIPRAGAYIFDFENINKQKFGTLKTYFGEPVANFNHAVVLKNVSSHGAHMQAGVPGKMFNHCLPDQCMEYYEQTYLPRFAALPQRTFDAIAKDFDTLNKMGEELNHYSFDFKNPNNFVLVGNTLRITDVIYATSLENPNSMAEMLNIFLSKMNINIFANYSKAAEAPRKELLKKIVLAGMKCNLNIGTRPAEKIIWQKILNDLCRLKISEDEVTSTLLEFQKNIPDTKLRLEAAKDYLNTICND